MIHICQAFAFLGSLSMLGADLGHHNLDCCFQPSSTAPCALAASMSRGPVVPFLALKQSVQPANAKNVTYHGVEPANPRRKQRYRGTRPRAASPETNAVATPRSTPRPKPRLPQKAAA
mmetsp:Transcript_32667/g.60897  ORF Transcript_32667/g.60897 Transcript_32667/m.60897 type:complete len:118 (-) Transcript_32667:306-659(-)